MRYYHTFIFIIFCLALSAQTKGIKPVKKTDLQNSGVTRAVIVGISDYQSEKIPDLQYAHRDAELFAEYLKSEDGGKLKEENVTLLLNEKATSGQFVAELYGLLEEGKEGDQTIIYFSGHGDVESSTISQPGFLLCWDAPHRMYMGGGTFGLSYLQEIISTISTQTKSKVIVITDACRAGKLAGSDIGGAQATAANLAKQYANEIKILSCQPDEFALESETWGGGRGVFSYYFLAGIQGLADRNNDNIVTLTEIDRYLEDNVTMAVDPHSQIPMVVGSRQTVISQVNPDIKQKLESQFEYENLNAISQKGVDLSIEDFSDTLKYKTYTAFVTALDSGHLLYPMEGSAWQLYQEISSYEELDSRLGLMKRNLAAKLQDEAQQSINKYLNADPEELKKRWKFDTNYVLYSEQLDKACQLLGPGHFYFNELKSRYYYYKGLSLRLESEQNKNKNGYNGALSFQDSCITLKPEAVHAINEKGYLYFLLEEYEESLLYYNKVKELMPSWPMVWNNLSISNLKLNNIDLARELALKSLELDSSFVSPLFNIGQTYQNSGDLEMAKKYYLECLDIDSSHVRSNTALGYIAFKNKDYNSAKKNYLKALEFDSNNKQLLINMGHLFLKQNKNDDALIYFQRVKNQYPNALEAFQVMIEFYFHTGNFEKAENELIDYTKMFPDDEFAFYLLASINGQNNRIEKALSYIKLAFDKGFTLYDTIEKDQNLSELIKTKEYELLKSQNQERSKK